MTPTPAKSTAAIEKKDVQKLQRAIVDGLEDVKAQDIQVFDTEHITAMFERVIVASGASNRQTKALAASVRDAVRGAGFSSPRVEGEDNGEWIIVDCGAAVAHIMQPAIRQYYHLEELWGDKPVKLRLGAAAPLPKASASSVEGRPAPKVARGKSAAAKTVGAGVAAATADKPGPGKRSAAAESKAPRKPATKKPSSKAAAAKKATAGSPARKKPGARKAASGAS